MRGLRELSYSISRWETMGVSGGGHAVETFSHFSFPEHKLQVPFGLEIRQESATDLTVFAFLKKMFDNHLVAILEYERMELSPLSPAPCSPPSLLGNTATPPTWADPRLRPGPAQAQSAHVMQNSRPQTGPHPLPAATSPQSYRHNIPFTGEGSKEIPEGVAGMRPRELTRASGSRTPGCPGRSALVSRVL